MLCEALDPHHVACNLRRSLHAMWIALQLQQQLAGYVNPLCALGVVCRLGDNQRAFDHLGTSLMHDSRNPRTILAAGSIIQVGAAGPACTARHWLQPWTG